MHRPASILAAVALAAGLATAADAGTLVFCSQGSPEGFDPALWTAPTTFDASSRTVYDRLVEFAADTVDIEPGLAERWEVSDDGLEYTFHLRPGVSFHSADDFSPTRHFNADDVLFSFARQLDAEHPWHDYGAGGWPYFEGMDMPAIVDEIVRVDDLTVRFVLTRPEAALVANLAMDFASILSKEYADSLDAAGTREHLNSRPVGTGPFRFVDYDEHARIRFAAHPDFWAGRQPVEELVFAITPDPSVRAERLVSGACDVVPDPDPADLPGLRVNPDIDVLEQVRADVVYLAYNTTQSPFDKAGVRRALNMAIDKAAIVEAVFGGGALPASSPLPPPLWAHNDASAGDAYDPEAARALLEAEGALPLSMRVWAMPGPRPYNPNPRLIAELIQADLAAVGVDVEIVSYGWDEYLARSAEIDRDGAVLLGWTGDNGDPDNFLTALLSCGAVGGANRAQWCHPPFDALLDEARTLADRGARRALYDRAQAIFSEEAPWAAIAHSLDYLAVSGKVRNMRQHPLGLHRFLGVDIAD
jgi:dipeptide transport system substrate-binding protein